MGVTFVPTYYVQELAYQKLQDLTIEDPERNRFYYTNPGVGHSFDAPEDETHMISRTVMYRGDVIGLVVLDVDRGVRWIENVAVMSLTQDPLLGALFLRNVKRWLDVQLSHFHGMEFYVVKENPALPLWLSWARKYPNAHFVERRGHALVEGVPKDEVMVIINNS
jgi:hypothetical protein